MYSERFLRDGFSPRSMSKLMVWEACIGLAHVAGLVTFLVTQGVEFDGWQVLYGVGPLVFVIMVHIALSSCWTSAALTIKMFFKGPDDTSVEVPVPWDHPHAGLREGTVLLMAALGKFLGEIGPLAVGVVLVALGVSLGLIFVALFIPFAIPCYMCGMIEFGEGPDGAAEEGADAAQSDPEDGANGAPKGEADRSKPPVAGVEV